MDKEENKIFIIKNMQINLKVNQLWWLFTATLICTKRLIHEICCWYKAGQCTISLWYPENNANVIFAGKTLADVQNKLKTSYWPAMKMNWKVWTPIQFININYVPVQVGIRTLHQSSLPDCIRLLWSIISFSFLLLFAQFRVLFANLVALFWYAYLASVRKWNQIQ